MRADVKMVGRQQRDCRDMNVGVQERSETERGDYAKETDCVGARGKKEFGDRKTNLSFPSNDHSFGNFSGLIRHHSHRNRNRTLHELGSSAFDLRSHF